MQRTGLTIAATVTAWLAVAFEAVVLLLVLGLGMLFGAMLSTTFWIAAVVVAVLILVAVAVSARRRWGYVLAAVLGAGAAVWLGASIAQSGLAVFATGGSIAAFAEVLVVATGVLAVVILAGARAGRSRAGVPQE